MTARIRENWAALTDVGRVRTHNEDSILAQPPLFIVADGLGGHEAGEVASSIAVETVRDHAPRRADGKALGRAARVANREVMRAAQEGIGRSGMGTTLTAAVVEGCHVAVTQVGDSRAYLLHDGHLTRVTEDHSMVADMVRSGQITEAESRVHPNRSVITRALGTDATMEPDTFEFDGESGDRLLLCSDGLTGMLTDAQIEAILASNADLEVAARALIDAANAAGGQDNISVVVVELEGKESTDARERSGRTRAWLAVLGWIAVFALVVAAIGFGTYRYAQDSYFLTSEGGVVVIYRGVPGTLGTWDLRWQLERTDTPVQLLSTNLQQRLDDGVRAESLEDAKRIAASYRKQAERSLGTTLPPAPGGY